VHDHHRSAVRGHVGRPVDGPTLGCELPEAGTVGGDGEQVLADRNLLEALFLILLSNALDAVSCRPPDARVVVVRTCEGGAAEVELSVEDSGEGIAPADLARIFEPFFTTKAAGLGVGLSVSRTIVEAHGGRLWAESEPGRGATLRCALPAWDDRGGQ